MPEANAATCMNRKAKLNFPAEYADVPEPEGVLQAAPRRKGGRTSNARIARAQTPASDDDEQYSDYDGDIPAFLFVTLQLLPC